MDTKVKTGSGDRQKKKLPGIPSSSIYNEAVINIGNHPYQHRSSNQLGKLSNLIQVSFRNVICVVVLIIFKTSAW